MSIPTAPCAWPVDYCGCSVPDAYDALEPEVKATYEGMATEYLWRWTGRVLGLCEVTVRPCRQNCSTVDSHGIVLSSSWGPVIINGQWWNIGCGRCGNTCGCGSAAPALVLPGPVDSITEVLIDGVVIDPTTYRVDNHRLLIREETWGWPLCQDMNLPLGEPNTWAITYQRGVAVPTGGQIAAGVLAVELWKAACRDPSCALPSRVQSITRQGVTIAVLDSFDDVDQGHTGIWLIDSWVASVTKAPARARVYSPDVRPRFRVTAPAPLVPPGP